MPFYPFVEGSPTKIDYRKKGYPYSNLSTGEPRVDPMWLVLQSFAFLKSGDPGAAGGPWLHPTGQPGLHQHHVNVSSRWPAQHRGTARYGKRACMGQLEIGSLTMLEMLTLAGARGACPRRLWICAGQRCQVALERNPHYSKGRCKTPQDAVSTRDQGSRAFGSHN